MRFILATLAVLILFISGCVKVSYLPSDESRNYQPTGSIKVYWEKPDVPYTVIGMITAESGVGEEKIFSKLKQKAMKVGANGIIMGATSQSSITVGSIYQGTGTVTSGNMHRLEAIAIRFNEK